VLPWHLGVASAKIRKRNPGNPALIKQAVGEEIGSTLTKEESAVIELLQHILSMRGLQYDSATLKSLLLWARRKDLIPFVNAAFEVQTWADIGMKLWEEISTGSKEVSKFSTLWKLIHETLKAMRAERGAAVSAFAALTPEGGSFLVTSLLFVGPRTLTQPVKAGGGQSRRPVASGEPVVQEKEHVRGDLLAQEFPPLPPESLPPPPPPRRGEGCAEAPPPADRPGATTAPSDHPMSLNPVPRYPPLPPPTLPSHGTPVTRCVDEKAAAQEVREDQLRELITKLERLQAHLDQSPWKVTDISLLKPPVPNPYNPFSLPAPPCAVPWDGGLETGRGSGVRWRGIATVMAVAVGVVM